MADLRRRAIARVGRLVERAVMSDNGRSLHPVAERAANSFAHRYVELSRRAVAHDDAGFRGSTSVGVLSRAYTDLVREHAPGSSFLDVGCMWRVHGAVSFLAEEVGAVRVTAFDLMDPTPEFQAAHAERSSKVNLVQGNLWDHHLADDVGQHDVVWCSGVLYHTPDPFGLVQDLQAAAGSRLVLGTKAIPEVPGFRQSAIFFPGLSEAERDVWAQLWGVGIGSPFGRLPWADGEWWWGLSASAIVGMVTAAPGWSVREARQLPWSGTYDNLFVIAERT